jgi:hypothetical protein
MAQAAHRTTMATMKRIIGLEDRLSKVEKSVGGFVCLRQTRFFYVRVKFPYANAPTMFYEKSIESKSVSDFLASRCVWTKSVL